MTGLREEKEKRGIREAEREGERFLFPWSLEEIFSERFFHCQE